MKVDTDEKTYFYEPYRDVLTKMNEAASNLNYMAYISLVDRLMNMSVLALTKEEFEHIHEIKAIQRAYVRELQNSSIRMSDKNQIVRRDHEQQIGAFHNRLRLDYIEYPLNKVIDRICTHALKRTVLRTQSTSNVAYKFETDIKETLLDIEFYLPDEVETPEEVKKWLKK